MFAADIKAISLTHLVGCAEEMHNTETVVLLRLGFEEKPVGDGGDELRRLSVAGGVGDFQEQS